ncbi:MAG: hypothetical protein LLG05_14400 [Porphyromonadaceae bacterium]|nr:hypothetical protein [Porphyromonadaceae bacterium]
MIENDITHYYAGWNMLTKEEQEKTKIKVAKDEQELRAKMKAIGDYEAKCKLCTWGITLTVLIVLEVMQFLFSFQIGILGMFLVGFVVILISKKMISSIIKKPSFN